jgi:hypothetical protein
MGVRRAKAAVLRRIDRRRESQPKGMHVREKRRRAAKGILDSPPFRKFDIELAANSQVWQKFAEL